MNRREFLQLALAQARRPLSVAAASSDRAARASGSPTSPPPPASTFRHNSGAYGGKLLPETLGSGCAFLDYDGDGWQDILLVNGMDWPGHKRRGQRSGPRCASTGTTATARSPT